MTVMTGVTLSERAATHIKNFLAKRGSGVGLKLGVRTSGCSSVATGQLGIIRRCPEQTCPFRDPLGPQS